MKKSNDGGDNKKPTIVSSIPAPTPISLTTTPSIQRHSRRNSIVPTGPKKPQDAPLPAKAITGPRTSLIVDELDNAILMLNDQYPVFKRKEPIPTAASTPTAPSVQIAASTAQPIIYQDAPLSFFGRIHAWIQAKLPLYARLTTLLSKHVIAPADSGGNDAFDGLKQVLQAIAERTPAANSLYEAAHNKIISFSAKKVEPTPPSVSAPSSAPELTPRDPRPN